MVSAGTQSFSTQAASLSILTGAAGRPYAAIHTSLALLGSHSHLQMKQPSQASTKLKSHSRQKTNQVARLYPLNLSTPPPGNSSQRITHIFCRFTRAPGMGVGAALPWNPPRPWLAHQV